VWILHTHTRARARARTHTERERERADILRNISKSSKSYIESSFSTELLHYCHGKEFYITYLFDNIKNK